MIPPVCFIRLHKCMYLRGIGNLYIHYENVLLSVWIRRGNIFGKAAPVGIRPCYKRDPFLLYFFVSQKSPVIECCIHPADSYQLLFIYAKIKPITFSLQNFYVFI